MNNTPEREALAEAICREVAELPDRSSPEDWPEAMIVTADELRNIVIDRLAALATRAPQAASVWRKAVQEAYGWLWHVNNEPMAPVPLWSPEKAAYEARKNLRELLTVDERGEAINSVRGMLENMAAAQPSGESK